MSILEHFNQNLNIKDKKGIQLGIQVTNILPKSLINCWLDMQ
jgi:hypothetical protein